MSQYETVTFKNIDNEDFTFYFNKTKEPNGFTVKAGEERQLVSFIAETGAKHLVDIVLQKKGVKDTNRDTELRRSLFAEILPDIQKVRPEIKKLSPEEELKAVKEELERQSKLINSFAEQKKESDNKDSKIEELTKQVEELKNLVKEKPAKKAGRPKKEVDKSSE